MNEKKKRSKWEKQEGRMRREEEEQGRDKEWKTKKSGGKKRDE